jgi:hypothetical protein
MRGIHWQGGYRVCQERYGLMRPLEDVKNETSIVSFVMTRALTTSRVAELNSLVQVGVG